MLCWYHMASGWQKKHFVPLSGLLHLQLSSGDLSNLMFSNWGGYGGWPSILSSWSRSFRIYIDQLWTAQFCPLSGDIKAVCAQWKVACWLSIIPSVCDSPEGGLMRSSDRSLAWSPPGHISANILWSSDAFLDVFEMWWCYGKHEALWLQYVI